MTLSATVERGYTAHAPALIAQYDAVPSDEIYASVRDLFPAVPVHVLDVGSGNGRDAEWCAAQGHEVTAVDPVAAFLAETMRRAPAATILRDRLPALLSVRGQFGLILVNGVWQHVAVKDRYAALARLSGLLAPGGRMVLSLRHGPGHPDRPVSGIDATATQTQAEELGLTVLRRCEEQSLQKGNIAHGVTWTWLVCERGTEA